MLTTENIISYSKVAKAADQLSKQGQKVTAEQVRRILGTGKHVDIANYLRKWQHSSNAQQVSQKSGQSHLKKMHTNSGSAAKSGTHKSKSQHAHPRNSGYSNHSSHTSLHHGFVLSEEVEIIEAPKVPFSKARLSSEEDRVQMLFWELYHWKLIRFVRQEEYQNFHQDLHRTKLNLDEDVLKFRKEMHVKTKSLMQELLLLRHDYERQRTLMRKN